MDIKKPMKEFGEKEAMRRRCPPRKAVLEKKRPCEEETEDFEVGAIRGGGNGRRGSRRSQ